MNNQQRAAMQYAIGVLTFELSAITRNEFDAAADKCVEAITALREALAQPQKPNKCANGCPERTVCDYCTAQPQGEWVDLTDDDCDEVFNANDKLWYKHWTYEYEQAFIAKFKEKNTPPVVLQGEPVAYICDDSGLLNVPVYLSPPSVEAAMKEIAELKASNKRDYENWKWAAEQAAEATKEKAANVAAGMLNDLHAYGFGVPAAIRSMK